MSLPVTASAVVACMLIGAAALLRRRRYAVLALVLSAALLGLARAPRTHASTATDLAYYTGRVAQIQGVIGAEPDIRDTGANYEVSVDVVTVQGKAIGVGGRLWVHTTRAVELEYGD